MQMHPFSVKKCFLHEYVFVYNVMMGLYLFITFAWQANFLSAQL
jgi:hypothetical protein